MKSGAKKKAISPVVTTVLLIVMVIVLAIIIFLWARSFIGEAVEKQIAGVKKTADKLCLEEVKFNAFVSNNELFIVNKGNVPIYEVNVKKTSVGTSVISNYTVDLDAGTSSKAIPFPTSGEKITIIPVLLGKAGNQKTKYTCPESVGVELET